MRNKQVSLGLAAVLALFTISTLTTATYAAAQSEKVLHSFGSNSKFGVGPSSSLIFDASGNLYGTTVNGGTDNIGTAYELSPKIGGGWTEKLLYSFAKNGTDGQNPAGGLIFDSAGNLYGTTDIGGTDGVGTVFELSPPVPPATTWTEKVLYSFLNNSTDGQNPANSLVMDSAGNLYGTTGSGGVFVVGTAFELRPTAGGGWTETVLHSFHQTAGGGDGSDPRSGLILDSAGNLYGTTLFGGALGGGTVYQLSPSTGGTWTETILYSFANDKVDGGLPSGGSLILDAAGNLYGTTTAGGPAGGGTVFRLSPSSGGVWKEKVLHYFLAQSSSDGSNPFGSLTLDSAGNLYGTTLVGGTGTCPGTQQACGIVYELRPTAGLWIEKILHNFNENGSDGYFPEGGVVLGSGGSLYGNTYYGGTFNEGTVFVVKP
ncbi:MAG TPA: choice-of-anchor tandem repeat GloVer-containing protein [Candidatus Acidoferrum sp.]|jgi:uncharacterized repeat protein (TIGR03803 family)|nr:choice-of-anchor tandem repeat GloVer-containing protein [Candidatus Acidoferrum sp.]